MKTTNVENIESKLTSIGNKAISHITHKIKCVAYVSILLFKEHKLIQSINNGYNSWDQYYRNTNEYKDSVFMRIANTNINDNGKGICFWNDTPHASTESEEIHKQRKKFGLFNGMTLLEKMNDNYVIGINITSIEMPEDEFYTKVIQFRESFFNELRNLLSKDI